MEENGVMFLNAALTVKPGEAGSHMKLWKEFSEHLAKYIAESSPNATWMLFGENAAYYYKPILENLGITNIVKACHPRIQRFICYRPFQKVAAFL